MSADGQGAYAGGGASGVGARRTTWAARALLSDSVQYVINPPPNPAPGGREDAGLEPLVTKCDAMNSDDGRRSPRRDPGRAKRAAASAKGGMPSRPTLMATWLPPHSAAVSRASEAAPGPMWSRE